MDLNELLYHHQLAMMNGPFGLYGPPEGVSSDLATHYADLLSNFRRIRNLDQYRWEQCPKHGVDLSNKRAILLAGNDQ